MSSRKKWLDDQRYIRMAGFLLVISPFANFFVSVAAASSSPNSLTVPMLWYAFVNVSALAWIMRALKVIVGLLMIRGKSSAWIPVMAILGFTIAYNLMTFKRDYSVSPMQAILSLLTNVVFFLIVFRAEFRVTQEINNKLKAVREQRDLNKQMSAGPQSLSAQPVAEKALEPVKKPLEFKMPEVKKAAAAPEPGMPQPAKKVYAKQSASKPAPVIKLPKKRKVQGEIAINKGTVVAFEGHGAFAKVIFCTADELWLESTGAPPENFKDRSIVLDSTKPKGSIRLRYDRTQNDSVLIFKVVS